MKSKTRKLLVYLALVPVIVFGILSILATGGDGDDDGGGGSGSSIPGPTFADQWHLKNTGQTSGTPGEDVNVEPVWASFKGTGVRIAIVDDGLEIGHEDLQANVIAGASFNYLTSGTDPITNPADPDDGAHGTSVAGVAAAVDGNSLGGQGAAPRAGLLGYNLLQDLTAANEANAMSRGSPLNDIYSNSWGPPDGFGTLDAAGPLWQTAIEDGLVSGRNGLGAIYTWAAGNGAPRDNSNYDGMANYQGVLAIAAVTDTGTQASYSEKGANLWVSTPGGEFCTTTTTHALSTTDRTGTAGFNNAGIDVISGFPDYADDSYTRCFNGTSAATPVASGVIALMLEANPNLGWRDVRRILAQTARQNDATDLDWVANGASAANGGPFMINHKYGFGVIDADAAVTAATTWTNAGAQATFTASNSPGLTILDGSGTIMPDVVVFGPSVIDFIPVSGSGITNIEFIEVSFTSDHSYAGDLEIVLTSPGGTVSRLAEAHLCVQVDSGVLINCGDRFVPGWRFGSARHLGEAADGNWTLEVRDGYAGDTGIFQSWSIKFYGT